MTTQATIEANKKEADELRKEEEEEKERKEKLESITWELDPDPPSDAITLEIGDEIIGTIMSEKEEVSGIHGSKQTKYDFQIVGEDEPRPLYCSTDLRRRLATHQTGDFVKIARIKDKPRTSPEKNPMHVFQVFSPKSQED